MNAARTEPSDICPRCGADRAGSDPCPSCGYEARHPGVLASFREAFAQLAERPSLIGPYLLAAALLTVLGAISLVFPQPEPQTLAGSVTVSVYLFLVGWWYLAAVGESARQQLTSPPPRGAMLSAAGAASAIVVAPLALATLLASLPPSTPGFAVFGLLGLLLLLGDLVLVGRAVGIPVEAARGSRGLPATVKAGLREGKAHAGIGFVLLGGVLFVLALLFGALGARGLVEALAASGRPVAPTGEVVLASLVRFPLVAVSGAITGLAIVAGLTGTTPAPARTFPCPRCGAEATVQGGRARCGCGLEGPYYEAG